MFDVYLYINFIWINSVHCVFLFYTEESHDKGYAIQQGMITQLSPVASFFY